jgi:acetyltransferase-like isoleucine patch superfamily enzyme
VSEAAARRRSPVQRLSLFAAGVVVSPLLVAWRFAVLQGRGSVFFASCSQLLSLIPGRTGSYLRRAFYRRTLLACGDDAHIEFGTVLAHRDVSIGCGVYIGTFCSLGKVTIGDNVMIGSNVDILSSRHQHQRVNGRLLGSESGSFSMVEIGANTWIGNSAVIMASVGESCIVGAGSVVVKRVRDGATVVGNPGREIVPRAVDAGVDSVSEP